MAPQAQHPAQKVNYPYRSPYGHPQNVEMHNKNQDAKEPVKDDEKGLLKAQQAQHSSTPNLAAPANDRGARPSVINLVIRPPPHPVPQSFPVPYPYPPYQLNERDYYQRVNAATQIQAGYRGYDTRNKHVVAARRKRIMPKILAGTLKLRVASCKELANTQCCGRMDPYIKVELGSHKWESEVSKSGGTDPAWPKDKAQYFLLDRKTKTLHLDVMNSNLLCDDMIGDADVEVKDVYENNEVYENGKWLKLHKATHLTGLLHLKCKYIAPIFIKVHGAKDLVDIQVFGRQDPYCVLDWTGPAPRGENRQRKTEVHEDAARNPVWNQTFEFNVATEQHLDLDRPEIEDEKSQDDFFVAQIWNDNYVKDDPIAYAVLPLKDLARRRKDSKKPGAYPLLKGAHKNRGREKGGVLYVSMV